MLTAIGRVAARRAPVPKLTTRLLQGPANRPNALPFAAARPLVISTWMRSPEKGAPPTGSKAKKTTAATDKKKTKPATKKKAKKPATKKKKAKKAKKPAAKATKKPKKELTPEEKDKADLKELKKMALLKGPALLPDSGWSVYVADNVAAGQGKVTDQIKQVAEKYTRLSEPEKERLKAIAATNNTANKENRQKWIESFPPEAIYMANIARRRIARKLDKSRIYLIHDDRQPKRARTSFTLFIKSRFPQVNSGMASGTAQDAFRAMSEEWRSLSESDKQSFKDEAAKEAETSQVLLKDIKEKARAYCKAQKRSPGQVPS